MSSELELVKELVTTTKELPPLLRDIRFHGAWDKRDSNPSKNYGIHGVELRMYVGGPDGATQFVLDTGWHWIKTSSDHLFPFPADLGYHSPKPMYGGESSLNCDVLPALGLGDRCYYDGSGLNAERIYKVLLEEGDRGVWRELTQYYADTFGYNTSGED